LRNPYRFSFDRATGRFYLADVGQGSWEEINTQNTLGGALANYGWDAFEGFASSGCTTGGLRGPAGHHEPIDVYGHGRGCSVTGGFVYRGSDLVWLRGWYLFADYCSGRVWRLLFRNGTLERDRKLMFDTGHNITSFGETGDGELLVVDHSGTIYRLAPNS
jgi:glucose/arabinose dehydrogenase